MILQQFRFSEENFLKKKSFSFLANSTPVIRRNECQKTFGEDPRGVCNTFHNLLSLTLAELIPVGAKIFSMPMKDNEKQDTC